MTYNNNATSPPCLIAVYSSAVEIQSSFADFVEIVRNSLWLTETICVQEAVFKYELFIIPLSFCFNFKLAVCLPQD